MEEIRSSETSVNTLLHGATSQKTAFFIVTAVKTSNLTKSKMNGSKFWPFSAISDTITEENLKPLLISPLKVWERI
jgi:hypothetical protein